jgi:hypothetical protein
MCARSLGAKSHLDFSNAKATRRETVAKCSLGKRRWIRWRTADAPRITHTVGHWRLAKLLREPPSVQSGYIKTARII